MYIPEDKEYQYNKDITFNKLLAYNSHQATGIRDLVYNPLNKPQKETKNIGLERVNKTWRINQLRNYIESQDVTLFNRNAHAIFKTFNENSLTEKFIGNALIDKYLIFRMEFNDEEKKQFQLLLNYLILNNEQRMK